MSTNVAYSHFDSNLNQRDDKLRTEGKVIIRCLHREKTRRGFVLTSTGGCGAKWMEREEVTSANLSA